MWGPGRSDLKSQSDLELTITPTPEWPGSTGPEEAGDQSDSDESVVSFVSSTSTKDLNESTVHWVSKEHIGVGQSFEFCQFVAQNPRTHKCHLVQSGGLKTLCNRDASDFMRLASGQDALDDLDLCKDCRKTSVKL